jgi:hypothetical protein
VFDGDMQPMKNMISMRFPAPTMGDGSSTEDNYWIHPSQNAMVIWFGFEGSYYGVGGSGLLDDLELLGYKVVTIDINFQKFEVMVEYIESMYGVIIDLSPKAFRYHGVERL